MSNYADAISGIESGGDYSLLGPQTKSGDRAYGKYQVMGANIPEWSKAALGRELSPQDFLSDPTAQDAIFNHRFGVYTDKYGPEGAARAWFAGEGGMNNPNAKDQLGTTVSSYANKFNRAMGVNAPELAQPEGSGANAPISQALKEAKPVSNTYDSPDQNTGLGALASRVIAGGPGALFGGQGEKNYDWPSHLQTAAAWLSGDPKMLDTVTKPREDFSLVQGADGTMYHLNKKTGAVRAIASGGKDDFNVVSGSDGSMYRINKRTGEFVPVANGSKDDFNVTQGADGSMYRVNKRTGEVLPVNTGSKLVPAGESPDGTKQYLEQRDGKYYPITIQQSTGTGSPLQSPFYAKGVTELNRDITDPDAYLAQYAPDVQSYVKALHEGRMPAAANPRKGFSVAANEAATRYGDLTGVLMDAASITERRKSRTELASGQIGTAGGQINSGLTALGHLNDLVKSYEPLHNWGVNGVTGVIPGSATAAQIINSVGNSRGDTAPFAEATDAFNRKYGGEVTRYITGSRGTGNERKEAASFTPNLMPAEVYQKGKAELDIMSEKSQALINQAKRTLGANDPKVIELQRALDERVGRVEAALERTKTGAKSGTETPSTTPAPRGRVLKIVPAPAPPDANNL